MTRFSKEFPISGQLVYDYLSVALSLAEYCVVRDIETLCSTNCEELGELWGRVSSSRGEVIRVASLLVALKNANQVICLDLCVQENPDRKFFIEDGVLIEDTL